MAKKIINYLQHAGKSYWREILAVLLLLVGIYFFRSERHESREILGEKGPLILVVPLLQLASNRSGIRRAGLSRMGRGRMTSDNHRAQGGESRGEGHRTSDTSSRKRDAGGRWGG